MKKTIITSMLLAIILVTAGLTACTGQKDSAGDNPELAVIPVQTPGEVYENEATGIGIVFPSEYIGKYTIVQYDVGSYSVFHNATNELFKEKDPGSIRGAIFSIEKLSMSAQEDIDFMNEAAIALFQTDEFAYYLRRPTPMDCYTDDMDNPATKEYSALYADEIINEIVESAYPLTTAANASGKNTSEVSPVYSALSRVSDEGMQDDYVYSMPDGDVNPALNVPLLFINGSFTAKGTGLLPDGKIEPGRPYVPVEVIVEAYGGKADWDTASQTMNIEIFDHVMQLTVNSTKAKVDGEEVTLRNTPILYSGCVYIASDDDLYHYFSLVAGYMPDFELPPFAYNPIVTVDKISTHNDINSVDVVSIKEYVKQQLMTGLENAKKGCVGTDYESAMLNAAPEIEQKIMDLSIYGSVSKYLMMDGPYQLLVDIYTKDIYFYISGHGTCFVEKADINDPYLFIPNYVGDF